MGLGIIPGVCRIFSAVNYRPTANLSQTCERSCELLAYACELKRTSQELRREIRRRQRALQADMARLTRQRSRRVVGGMPGNRTPDRTPARGETHALR